MLMFLPSEVLVGTDRYGIGTVQVRLQISLLLEIYTEIFLSNSHGLRYIELKQDFSQESLIRGHVLLRF